MPRCGTSRRASSACRPITSTCSTCTASATRPTWRRSSRRRRAQGALRTARPEGGALRRHDEPHRRRGDGHGDRAARSRLRADGHESCAGAAIRGTRAARRRQETPRRDPHEGHRAGQAARRREGRRRLAPSLRVEPAGDHRRLRHAEAGVPRRERRDRPRVRVPFLPPRWTSCAASWPGSRARSRCSSPTTATRGTPVAGAGLLRDGLETGLRCGPAAPAALRRPGRATRVRRLLRQTLRPGRAAPEGATASRPARGASAASSQGSSHSPCAMSRRQASRPTAPTSAAGSSAASSTRRGPSQASSVGRPRRGERQRRHRVAPGQQAEQRGLASRRPGSAPARCLPQPGRQASAPRPSSRASPTRPKAANQCRSGWRGAARGRAVDDPQRPRPTRSSAGAELVLGVARAGGTRGRRPRRTNRRGTAPAGPPARTTGRRRSGPRGRCARRAGRARRSGSPTPRDAPAARAPASAARISQPGATTERPGRSGSA